MATVRPFKALRPVPEKAPQIACLPYDVMSREEAFAMAEGNPLSFLRVVRSEIELPDTVDSYDAKVYQHAREVLERMEQDGNLIQDEKPCFYIYQQIMHGRVQTGLVATVSVEEYWRNEIKKHEFTRRDKELDRTTHFNIVDANTEPVFLTYRHRQDIAVLIEDFTKAHSPSASFTREGGISHRFWVLDDDSIISELGAKFADVDALYIADGHHRSASAATVGRERRRKFPEAGEEAEFNYFMAVIFPDDDLLIMDYNRVVHDLAGLTVEAFLSAVGEAFVVTPHKGADPYRPRKQHSFGMYLDGAWYELVAKEHTYADKGVIEMLDVSILQENLLGPVLKIQDPRTDSRIDFVGGIRGLAELERRVDERGTGVAFSLYPTTMEELLSVADQELTMPPKSTWFEPKLCSGLFVHKLSD